GSGASASVAEVITAGSGSTSVLGSQAGDSIVGGAGKDILDGGFGADTLTGGAGADIFRYTNFGDSTAGTPGAVGGVDSITDFA
ncbi:serine 3-dehydrogenase, partial [Salmonella enterica]